MKITARTNRPGGVLAGLVSVPKRKSYASSSVNVTTHKKIKQLFRAAVRAFIVETLNHVHVDSGMSAASLQPLAAKVQLRSAIVESLQGFGPTRGHQNAYGAFADNNAKWKSRALGQRLGQEAYELEFGTPRSPICKMVFEVPVLQFYLHEYGYAASNTAPWAALTHGAEAFKQYIKNHWSEYISGSDLAKWIVTGDSYDTA